MKTVRTCNNEARLVEAEGPDSDNYTSGVSAAQGFIHTGHLLLSTFPWKVGQHLPTLERLPTEAQHSGARTDRQRVRGTHNAKALIKMK